MNKTTENREKQREIPEKFLIYLVQWKVLKY